MELLHIRSNDADDSIFPYNPQVHLIRMDVQTYRKSCIETQLRNLPDAHVYSRSSLCMGKDMGYEHSTDHDIVCRHHIYNRDNHHASAVIHTEKQILHRIVN